MNATLEISQQQDRLLLTLGGSWSLGEGQPDLQQVFDNLAGSVSVTRVELLVADLKRWDTSLISFLLKIWDYCRERNVTVVVDALPAGVCRLLELATAVPEREDARREEKYQSILDFLGRQAIGQHRSLHDMLSFVGAAFLSCLRLLVGKARLPWSDLLLFVRECGYNALPIVSVISLLVGLILAFIGAVQLKMFGVQIFVADLVGIGMARDMGAMMTGIIMAGRTGASYAAQLGTMQVNEEIDALQTFGISPMEFLVLPRLLAMTMMMPLLSLYAVLMGILGGAIVGIGLFEITPMQYFLQTQKAVPLHHFATGMIKALAYGMIVALTGCLRGIQCGRSASAVGAATTSAVVTSIIWIVISCAILTVVFFFLGI